ncbi:MAG TPA: hypothetical protein VK842_00330, partial [bacterium]|nr:hypothetical protein [bacterium]
MFKTAMLGILFVAAAASAVAAVPEGRGTLGMDLQLGQGSTLQGGNWGSYQAGTPYGVSLWGDAPIWSGIAMGLGLDASNHPYSMNINGFAPKSAENIAVYGLDAELRLYSAAFLGKSYKPGDGANPDGWLLWPSLTIRYGYSKQDDFNYGWFSAPINREVAIFTTTQDFGYELILPATPWLSVRAGYLRSSEEDLDYSEWFGPGSFRQLGGAYEGEGLGLSGFINLVKGAGADVDRAFVPHFGRVGQLRVDFDWKRQIDMTELFTPQVVGSQSYRLAVGTALNR